MTPISSSFSSSRRQLLRKSSRPGRMRDWQDHSSSRVLRLRPQHLLGLLPSTESWVVHRRHRRHRKHRKHRRANLSSRLPRDAIHSLRPTTTPCIQLDQVNQYSPACQALSILTTIMTTLILRHIVYPPSPLARTARRPMVHPTQICRLGVRPIRDFRLWVCLPFPIPCPASTMRQTLQPQSWQGRPLLPVTKAIFLRADTEPRPIVLFCLVSILLTGSQVTLVMFPQWHHWVTDQEP